MNILKMANNGFILLINAAQDEEERLRNRVLRRGLRDQSDPLDMTENQFKNLYRLSRDMARQLIETLGPHLPQGVREELFIPHKLKIMVALNFFAQGSYQKAVGQDHFVSMSQSSVSRCITAVITALETLYFKISFPVNEEQRSTVKQGFMEMRNGFPGIIGAVDGTHIAIVAPSINDEIGPPLLFYNRKGYYSLNVQIICDSKLKILAMNARYPGSVHDSAIWSTSQIKQFLENNYTVGDHSSWLLGDSGYPLEPWLMTPIQTNNLTPAEERYNAAHKSTRNVVERCIGVLKGRFRCLQKHRVLHYTPLVAAKIIYGCGVLHNICVERGEEAIHIENDFGIEGEAENIDVRNPRMNLNNQGQLTRQRIIRNHFNILFYFGILYIID